MRRFLLTSIFLSIPAWPQPAQQQAQPPIVVKVVEMPPTPPKGFLDYLQELGPVIAASVAVCVWWNQRHLQKQHLKQSLFDRRYKVYEAVISASIGLLNTNLTQSQFNPLFFGTVPAEFLFDDDEDVRELIDRVKGLCREIEHESGLLQLCRTDSFGDPSGGTSVAKAGRTLLDKKRELSRVCESGGSDSANQVFRRYLRLYEEPWYIRLKNGYVRLKTGAEKWMASQDRQRNSRCE